MPLKPTQVRWGTGVLLALATLLTRIPFVAKTLFEFDSVDFAVALNRFSLREVTPHMPGYILHILFGRIFYAVTGDANAAFVVLSILLSIGSVLFLWRAAAELRGERVALLAAVLWLTTPLFWFHGEIAAIYIEEAFFAAVLLYVGLRILRRGVSERSMVLLAVAFSFAIGARQSSLLFYLPAICYLLFKVRVSLRAVLIFSVVFLVTTALWFTDLLVESGGLREYLHFLFSEHIYRSQSVLFGNGIASQLQTSGKVMFYQLVAIAAIAIVAVPLKIVFWKKSVRFTRSSIQSAKFRFVALLAAVPLGFYIVIYFMKPGYLLNVLPSEILIAAVFFDQCAIWIAERVKRRPENKLLLTRPIITRNVIWIGAAVSVINILWFVGNWPGTGLSDFLFESTNNDLLKGAALRTNVSNNAARTVLNRAFTYTNVHSILAQDLLNDTVRSILTAAGANSDSTVILSTWWFRWAYMEFPKAQLYDIQAGGPDLRELAIGLSHNMNRENIYQKEIYLLSHTQVLLMLRHDSKDFEELSRQVSLERLPGSENLDIYRITSPAFDLNWREREFLAR